MNIKIYVKTINIIKNYKKIFKIVYFITIFKKFALPSQTNFYNFHKYFIILRYFMLWDMIL